MGGESLYNVEATNSQSQVETSYTVGGVKFLDKIETNSYYGQKSIEG